MELGDLEGGVPLAITPKPAGSEQILNSSLLSLLETAYLQNHHKVYSV